MTDDVIARPPSYSSDVTANNKLPLLRHNSSVKSKDDVMAWLKNCDEAEEEEEESSNKDEDTKEYDSDYSSNFYKTSSPSSSLADVSSVSPTKYRQPTTTIDENEEPTESSPQTKIPNTNEYTTTNDLVKADGEGRSSDFSEGEYSASEEDVFDDNHDSPSALLNNKKPRSPSLVKSRDSNKKGSTTKRNSMNSFKRQLSTNGFVKLDDHEGKPTSYLWYDWWRNGDCVMSRGACCVQLLGT